MNLKSSPFFNVNKMVHLDGPCIFRKEPFYVHVSKGSRCSRCCHRQLVFVTHREGWFFTEVFFGTSLLKQYYKDQLLSQGILRLRFPRSLE